MSDGPHRSLPMRRHWKVLAERAAKAAFSKDEIQAPLPLALRNDFLAEAPIEAIREILGGGQQSDMFSDDRVERLEAARSECCGSTAGNVLIDCAIEAVYNGQSGEVAIVSALANALGEYCLGEFRAVEEHYQREANARSARFVRERLDGAREQTDFRALARDILSPSRGSNMRIVKQTGLHEGPPL